MLNHDFFRISGNVDKSSSPTFLLNCERIVSNFEYSLLWSKHSDFSGTTIIINPSFLVILNHSLTALSGFAICSKQWLEKQKSYVLSSISLIFVESLIITFLIYLDNNCNY